jgi:hypothetical protein
MCDAFKLALLPHRALASPYKLAAGLCCLKAQSTVCNLWIDVPLYVRKVESALTYKHLLPLASCSTSTSAHEPARHMAATV